MMFLCVRNPTGVSGLWRRLGTSCGCTRHQELEASGLIRWVELAPPAPNQRYRLESNFHREYQLPSGKLPHGNLGLAPTREQNIRPTRTKCNCAYCVVALRSPQRFSLLGGAQSPLRLSSVVHVSCGRQAIVLSQNCHKRLLGRLLSHIQIVHPSQDQQLGHVQGHRVRRRGRTRLLGWNGASLPSSKQSRKSRAGPTRQGAIQMTQHKSIHG
mmetsp:Transcript_75697/g.202462  ORF Transcript_75697/g.202462 Transcript_75697/m.202462 type:complete len:213 (-) Transcript_75697:253-891(-)